MSALADFSALNRSVGVKYGESAKQLRQRDPQAAERLAAFLKARRAEMVRDISGILISAERRHP